MGACDHCWKSSVMLKVVETWAKGYIGKFLGFEALVEP